MPTYFITSNEGKFREAKILLPQLEQVEFDLPEEQSLNPQLIIEKKLDVARTKQSGALVVEDTSLYLHGLNGFPGPLVKWMLEAIGNQGIYELCQSFQNPAAIARTVIGYDDGAGNVHFFDGEIKGKIVKPSGKKGFGWDAIFQPQGLNETFAEIGDAHKMQFSMRTNAFRKLRDFLETTPVSNF